MACRCCKSDRDTTQWRGVPLCDECIATHEEFETEPTLREQLAQATARAERDEKRAAEYLIIAANNGNRADASEARATSAEASVRQLEEDCAGARQEVEYLNNRVASAEAARDKLAQAVGPIGEAMRTQDNRATAWPVFVVQQRNRIYGFDPDYCDNVVWINQCNDSCEATEEEAAQFEADYGDTGREPGDGWLRTAYIDIWEHVTTCFTEIGANAYIKANGHNLKHPRVYVESAYRNIEWQTVAQWLRDVSTPVLTGEAPTP